jgi:predicted Zn finger-like uncharacterized protein
MALATRCPHCHTTFRVAHDQLKLRSGLVRCGACKEIFNGIEHLLPPEEPAGPSLPPASIAVANRSTPAISPAVKEPPAAGSEPVVTKRAAVVPGNQTARSVGTEESGDFSKHLDAAEDLDSSASFPVSDRFAPEPALDIAPDENDPLQRMTLMDSTGDEPDARQDTEQNVTEERSPEKISAELAPDSKAENDAPDPIDQAIEALQSKPFRRPRHAEKKREAADEAAPHAGEAYKEPDFVKKGRRQQQFGRVARITMGIASVFLLLGGLGQGAYAFRDRLAASFPEAKPVLAQFCSVIGCRVDLPTQIDAVSIESSELQALPNSKGKFLLTTLLRNRGTTVQAWPNIELTLNDASDKAIARRVITPREYLPAATETTKGFAAASEQPVKMAFEVPQLAPAGYRVYLFYP